MASILQLGGKWRALVRRRGHKSICSTHRTKAAAQAWARRVESELDAGRSPATIRAAKVTVGDLIERYRKLRAASRPILDTSNEHYMLAHLEEGLGARRVDSLSPDDLVAWCQQRAEEGAGPYTCNMELSKLGTVMRYAGVAMRLALPDVVGAARPLLGHLGLIGGGGKRARRPTEDEFARLIAYLLERHPARYADAVAFAAVSTLRRGELCRIEWRDVDHAKRMVLVRDRKHPRRKAGNDEWVPLLGLSWDLVQAQPQLEDEPRVFPIHPQTLSKYVTQACRALAIPDLHLHDMRHEGTSKLFEQGFAIEQVALVTGHKDWRQLARYTNLRPEHLHGTKPKRSR